MRGGTGKPMHGNQLPESNRVSRLPVETATTCFSGASNPLTSRLNPRTVPSVEVQAHNRVLPSTRSETHSRSAVVSLTHVVRSRSWLAALSFSS